MSGVSGPVPGTPLSFYVFVAKTLTISVVEVLVLPKGQESGSNNLGRKNHETHRPGIPGTSTKHHAGVEEERVEIVVSNYIA
jgi:hypothetical protein